MAAPIRKRRFPIVGEGGGAKRELGWRPRHPGWRQGFARGLG